MPSSIETFTLADEATHSNAITGHGRQLVVLDLPTLDSTTVQFEASVDGGTTWRDIFTNSGTPAALTLGTADTGGKVVAVPAEVARISAHAHIRLQMAAQNGGPRTIKGIYAQVES